MTNLFKCKKSGQMCCAPKSRILEKQGLNRNDTYYPPAPPPPPPSHHYHQHNIPPSHGPHINNPQYSTNVLPQQIPPPTMRKYSSTKIIFQQNISNVFFLFFI